jgi:DNA-directed RNA polymerase beta subunit
MDLNLTVPAYDLGEDHIFNIRNREWTSTRLVGHIQDMLKCAEKFGIRVKSITLDKHHKIDHSEIKKTNSRLLRIVLSHSDDKELDLTYDIPWLVGNHFYIGGNKKISLFQLFDHPLIMRNNIIKIRTNIHSFTLVKKTRKRQDYYYYLNVFSREIPFAYILLAYKPKQDLEQMFGCKFKDDGHVEFKKDPHPAILDLTTDINDVLNNQLIDKGSLMAPFFNRKADEKIIENIVLTTEVDVFSKKFFHTPNIIEEFVFSLTHTIDDDCNYDNKRIRFVEQLVYSYLCKDFYTMITTLKASKKSRFCNNSKVILSNANSSAIVHFDFSLNPLAELAMITKLSLSGPGGFEKGNVPSYLRDIHPSQFGRVCPADTGDRDSCGTTQYIVPTSEFGDGLEFPAKKEDCINSIAISHVPFLEHDDPTRLQMSSSQQRHSIMLKEFDVPLIQSGVEGMYTDQTSFIFKAERSGKVVYRDDDVIIVQYSNKMCKPFNIGFKKLSLRVYDFYHVYFDIGQTFNKGDIIAESNYLSKGRLTIGKNLLASVMVWHGYNYEDGIVISDRLVKDDVFTSVHFLDLSFEISPNKLLLNLNDDYRTYKPLPEVGDELTLGDTYARIKTISGFGDSNDVIFDDSLEKVVTENCKIIAVKIYCNKWNKDFPQYDEFIKTYISDEKKSKSDMIENLGKFLTQDELEIFLESVENDKTEKRRGNYKIKGDSIDGLRVEITAMYERPITVGDKIGNRHGNKGVISKIVPENQMPRLEDGRSADVVINPLGIISRMNIGQLFELHLAMSVVDLKRKIKNKHDEGELTKEWLTEYILGYIAIIDSTDGNNYTAQMKKYLAEIELDYFMDHLDDFYIIQPPYESIKIEQLDEAMTYTNTPYEYPAYDPSIDPEGQENRNLFKKNIIQPVAFGFQYFIKMNHIAKDKLAARGVGPYASKTCQPLDGKSRKGGQRVGEMEMWAIAAQGAESNLWEILTTKSDSIKRRNNYISQKVHNDSKMLDEDDDPISQSVRLFQSKLKTIGLDYQINEEND